MLLEKLEKFSEDPEAAAQQEKQEGESWHSNWPSMYIIMYIAGVL